MFVSLSAGPRGVLWMCQVWTSRYTSMFVLRRLRVYISWATAQLHNSSDFINPSKIELKARIRQLRRGGAHVHKSTYLLRDKTPSELGKLVERHLTFRCDRLRLLSIFCLRGGMLSRTKGSSLRCTNIHDAPSLGMRISICLNPISV